MNFKVSMFFNHLQKLHYLLALCQLKRFVERIHKYYEKKHPKKVSVTHVPNENIMNYSVEKLYATNKNTKYYNSITRGTVQLILEGL